MKEEICNKELKLSKTKEIKRIVEPYVKNAIGKNGILIQKYHINNYDGYVCIVTHYYDGDKYSYVNVDKTIEIRDKKLYKELKTFGQLYRYDKIIKCWEGVADE